MLSSNALTPPPAPLSLASADEDSKGGKSYKPVLSPRSSRGNSKPKLILERILGLTTFHNAALSIHPITGEVAYAAGCVVVIYNLRRNRQTRFYRASKPVSCISFSPDGQYLAIGERGHQPAINIWDAQTGELKTELKKHKFGVSCIAFHPTSRYLVSIGHVHDRFLYVWELKESRQKNAGVENTKFVGEIVGCSKLLQKIYAVEFNEDGSFFVTSGEKHVKFWYVDKADNQFYFTGKKLDNIPILENRLAIMPSHAESIFLSLSCGCGKKNSGMNKVYAVTADGILCCFGPSRIMERFVSLEASIGYCLSVTEEYIVVGCSTGIVRLFQPSTLEYITTLPNPPPLGGGNSSPEANISSIISESQFPGAICIRITGTQVVIIYRDRTLLVYDIQNVENVGLYRSFLFHSGCIYDIDMVDSKNGSSNSDTFDSFLPSGSFITCSIDNTVRFWNLDVHKKKKLSRNSKAYNQSKNGADSSAVWKNPYNSDVLKILYLDSKEEFVNNNPDVLGGCCSGDFIPNIHSEKPSQSISSNSSTPVGQSTASSSKTGLRSIALDQSRMHLACGDRNGVVRVYDINNQKWILAKKAHDGEVLSLSYTPLNQQGIGDAPQKEKNRLLASGSRDRLVHVFNASKNYEVVQTLDNHSAAVMSVGFSNDAKYLYSCGGDQTIVLSTIAEQNESININRFQSVSGSNVGTISDLAIDPSGKYLITTGQKKISIYNSQSGKHLKSYNINEHQHKIVVDNGGYSLATCSGGGSVEKYIRLFDFHSGELLTKVTGHSDLITSIRFTPDGRRLVSVSADGCIFVWRLADELQNAIKSRLKNKPPQDEQQHQLVRRRRSELEHMEAIASLRDHPPEKPAEVVNKNRLKLLKDNKRKKLNDLLDATSSYIDNFEKSDPPNQPIPIGDLQKQNSNNYVPPGPLGDQNVATWAKTQKLTLDNENSKSTLPFNSEVYSSEEDDDANLDSKKPFTEDLNCSVKSPQNIPLDPFSFNLEKNEKFNIPGPLSDQRAVADWAKTKINIDDDEDDECQYEDEFENEEDSYFLNREVNKLPNWSRTLKSSHIAENDEKKDSVWTRRAKKEGFDLLGKEQYYIHKDSITGDNEEEDIEKLYFKKSGGSVMQVEVCVNTTELSAAEQELNEIVTSLMNDEDDEIVNEGSIENFSDLEAVVTLSSERNLQQEREMFKRKEKHIKTANAVSNMNLKLKQLGIFKSQSSKRLAILNKEKKHQRKEKESEPLHEKEEKMKIDNSFEMLPPDVSLSSFTHGYKEKDLNCSGTVKDSYSKFTDGYSTAATPCKIQNSSDGLNLESTSLSNFTHGYIETNAKQPEIDSSLSSFTSGYIASNQTELNASEKSMDGIDVAVSLSKFTKGYSESADTGADLIGSSIGAPEETSINLSSCPGTQDSKENLEKEVSASANCFETNVPVDMSLSHFTSGYVNEGNGRYVNDSAIDESREKIKQINESPSVDSNLTQLPVDVSLSYFTSGYSNENHNIDEQSDGAIVNSFKELEQSDVSFSVDSNLSSLPVGISLSQFTTGYVKEAHNEKDLSDEKELAFSSSPCIQESKKSDHTSIPENVEIEIKRDRLSVDVSDLYDGDDMLTPLSPDKLDANKKFIASSSAMKSQKSYKTLLCTMQDNFKEALDCYSELKSITSSTGNESKEDIEEFDSMIDLFEKSVADMNKQLHEKSIPVNLSTSNFSVSG